MPPALTEADVAGNWAASLMPEGSDSVLTTATYTCGSGSCRFVSALAPNDTVPFTYTISGDSTVYSAAAYKDAQSGAMVTNSGVSRVSGNTASGSGMVRLADKPDSVVLRYRFTATRQP
jgi:type IV secretory pathway TrbL component